jgi:hypothetical protein
LKQTDGAACILNVKTLAKLAAVALPAALILGFFWWRSPGAGTTFIQLTGNPGDSFTGFYVREGQRVEVNGTLPWKVASTAISKAEFRKAKANEPLTIEARYKEVLGMDAFVSGPILPQFAGMRIRVHRGGIGMEPIRQ